MVPEGGGAVLGVLGGMGPDATTDFLARLARLTPAASDQDHVPTLVYADPSTPDRSDAILGGGPSPLPAMLRGVEFLSDAGCAVIAIPCNSAHFWYDDLAAVSSVPVPHIVDATAEQLGRLRAGSRVVGLMATDGTSRSGVYHHRLAQLGIIAVDLTDLGDPSPMMRGIRSFKAGDHAAGRDQLLAGGQELIRRGAEALIFGCTDISAALAETSAVDGVPVVHASECLARVSLDRLAASSVTPH